MSERRLWLGLALLSTVLGAVQLPWAPARFGGVFLLALAAGCAGEAYMLHLRTRHKLCAALAVAGRILFALFVLSFAYIQLVVIGSGLRMDAYSRENVPNTDYFLVLGALVNPNGQPSAALAARCDTAAALLTQYPKSQAILCGGQGANEPRSEADAMFDYLTARGIDPARLHREDKSNNTIENIQNAREFLAPSDRTAVVTSDYHVARARVLLQSAGLDPVGIPAPTPYPGQWISVRCREYCSIVGLMLTGRW